jgi:hypothetical protein
MTGLDFYVSGDNLFYLSQRDGFNLFHLYQERLILTDIRRVNNLYRTYFNFKNK